MNKHTLSLIIKLSLITIATIILTAICFKLAFLERGYVAMGGECLIPVFGVLMAVNTIENHQTARQRKHSQNRKLNRLEVCQNGSIKCGNPTMAKPL